MSYSVRKGRYSPDSTVARPRGEVPWLVFHNDVHVLYHVYATKAEALQAVKELQDAEKRQ